ncbi:hypothetical protein FGG08_003728 [Glutinoglossum americanum]|uniref:Uncharacterized protein n=1 Tax=Glutinoglossum americanum TaxID=1670608 RepID=A0A9P8I744_9PEZI|nr:hypothetical protein FGG08_003728 [Glutinoglossum americanum]
MVFEIDLFTSSPAIRVVLEKFKGVVREMPDNTLSYDEAERVAWIMGVENLTLAWNFAYLLLDLVGYTKGEGWEIHERFFRNKVAGSKVLEYGDEPGEIKKPSTVPTTYGSSLNEGSIGVPYAPATYGTKLSPDGDEISPPES